MVIGTMNNLRVVFLGPPGSGKGSQAVFVKRRHNIAHISTGDLLREAVKSGSPLGLQVADLMEQGSLVPDNLVLNLIAERLGGQKDSQGFLLDGFPRSLNQAEGLNQILAESQLPLTFVLHLDIAQEAVVKRLSGRRTCIACGRIFNIYFNPPKKGSCDDCNDEPELMQRSDDNEESIKHRLNVYDQQTKPLLDFYEDLGLLRTVDASGTVEQIAQDVERAIQKEIASTG